MANGSNGLALDDVTTRKGALVLRAINHKLRQQILKLIHQKERITVTEIYVKLRLEQSVASQHLGILRVAGVVKTEREGKHIFYSLDYKRLDTIQTIISKMVAKT
jgi:DNA-binding transcriptional ArsR family regulator